VPAHGLAPQNLSPDKRVDVCADSDEDRGSTPLASTFKGYWPSLKGATTTELAMSANVPHLLIRFTPIWTPHESPHQVDFDRLPTFVAVAEELSMEPFVSDDNHERLVQFKKSDGAQFLMAHFCHPAFLQSAILPFRKIMAVL